MKTIEELLRFSDITPSEEYAITMRPETDREKSDRLRKEFTEFTSRIKVKKHA